MKTVQEFVLEDQLMVLGMLPFSRIKKERNSALKWFGCCFFFRRKKRKKRSKDIYLTQNVIVELCKYL